MYKNPNYRQEYYEKNKHILRAKAKVKRSLDAENLKSKKLLRKFGIDLKEYNRLLELQGNVCAICGNPEKIDGRSLAVDHDHITLKVRGLLCFKCNTMVGHVDKNDGIINNMIQYLEGESNG